MRILYIVNILIFSLTLKKTFADEKCQFFMVVPATTQKTSIVKNFSRFFVFPHADRVHDSSTSPRLPLIATTNKDICKDGCYLAVTLEDSSKKIIGNKKFKYEYSKSSKSLEPIKKNVLLFDLWNKSVEEGQFLFKLSTVKIKNYCSFHFKINLRNR